MAATYIESQRGGRKLIFGGYEYTKHRGEAQRTEWRCVRRVRSQDAVCKGRAQGDGDQVKITSDHNHPPSSQLAEAAIVMSNIKTIAKASQDEPRHVIEHCLAGASEEAICVLPDILFLEKKVNLLRKRKRRQSVQTNIKRRTYSNSPEHDIPSQIVVTTPMDGVCRIVLSNPQQRNTLTSDVLITLKEQLVSYSQNPEMRCIILGAEGGVFSAGHNLKELTTSHGSEHHAEVMKLCTDLALAIRTLPVPVVAEVNGLATAAGCQLVASCDIVVASENALFSTPGANAGIFCSTPGVAVARALPLKVAAYMVFTGLPISAQEAVQYGLVSRVVSEGKLQAEAIQIAMSIKSKSRSVIELGKKFFYKQIEQDVESAYRDAEKVMVQNLAMKDAQEGISAFIEKRKPYWTHSTEEVGQPSEVQGIETN